MAEIGTDIQRAKELLEQGGLVGIPTETVYGLAANGLDAKAASNIFKVKKRPSFDPLILHTYSLAALEKFAGPIPEKALKLTEKYWPGPLTLVLPKKEVVPAIVSSGLPTVAVRVPNHPLTLELLKSLAFPLAAPSANPFGFVSPTTAQHVNDYLGNEVDYILDGGKCSVGLESTIISFTTEKPQILRKGGLAIEDVQALIGEVEVKSHSTSQPEAPGMLSKHYSPGVPLVLGNLEELIEKYKHLRYGVISFSKKYHTQEPAISKVLSEDEDLAEAARNLFAFLREFAELKPEIVLVEQVPQFGLGLAINDRLKRAAAS